MGCTGTSCGAQRERTEPKEVTVVKSLDFWWSTSDMHSLRRGCKSPLHYDIMKPEYILIDGRVVLPVLSSVFKGKKIDVKHMNENNPELPFGLSSKTLIN
jgi:hypothetical protein